jgi:A/G-specific adenine glycosylase
MSGGATCELVPAAAARVDRLREELLSWFERGGRCFPWREPGRTAYEVTLAEILLQRTTAAQVAQIYPDFLERYPAWDSLARAAPAELEGVLRPLGLWRQKARALQRLARSLEERHGLVPWARRELERLPGIGPYTASAVLAVVYGQAEPLLDANLARLLGRCFGLSPHLARGSRTRLLQALALRLVRDERSLRVSWAALDFAALVCRPRRPLCAVCPLRSECAYALLLEPQASPSAGAPSG